MTALLASVRSLSEAEIALQSHADIIDCKNPDRGALGALTPLEIARIVTRICGKRPVSATVGDLAPNTEQLRRAIRGTAACGVDYIKFGLFAAADAFTLVDVLGELPRKHKLIAVCFADRFDPIPLLPLLAALGCHGVMIDTAHKRGESLTELWPPSQLARFVHKSHRLGLLCGLAGKLRLDDIPHLLPLGSDYLGFRSALCAGDGRKLLDPRAMARVRNALPRRVHTPIISQARPAGG